LTSFLRKTHNGLLELLEKIHFSDVRNRNVKATFDRNDVVEYHDGNKWLFGQKDKILSRLIENGHGLMQNHFDENEDALRKSMSNSLFRHVAKWLDQMDEKQQEVYHNVLVDVFLLLINNTRNVQ